MDGEEFHGSRRASWQIGKTCRSSRAPPICSLPWQSLPRPGDVAIEKREAGEEITLAAAKRIVAEARNKRRPRRQKAVPADKLGVRLIKMLRRYQERWPGELSDLARHLREFADALDMRSKKRAKG